MKKRDDVARKKGQHNGTFQDEGRECGRTRAWNWKRLNWSNFFRSNHGTLKRGASSSDAVVEAETELEDRITEIGHQKWSARDVFKR